MYEFLEKEYNDFKLHHKNIYNILFHIICGICYLTILFLSLGEYKNEGLSIYIVLLMITLNDLKIVFPIIVTLTYLVNYTHYFESLEPKSLFGFFVLFYFLPDISHYFTNNQIIMHTDPYKIFINTFYLLPFSIKCLIS